MPLLPPQCLRVLPSGVPCVRPFCRVIVLRVLAFHRTFGGTRCCRPFQSKPVTVGQEVPFHSERSLTHVTLRKAI